MRRLCLNFGLVFMLQAGGAQAETRVVVTSKPVHSLVASVMGAAGRPTLLVTGSASPHTYAMKPSDAKAVNAAQVFFRVSAELEPFTAKLVTSLGSSVRVVTLAETPGLKRLAKREGGAFEEDGHAGHGHKAGSDDETDAHVWLDPGNAALLAGRIAAVLGEADPGNAAVFKANADALAGRIDQLAADLRRTLEPVKGKSFIVFHDAYQYFEAWSGLAAAGSITTSPDVQPNGKRLTALRRKIASAKVACVFAEPQYQPKVVAALTEGLAVKPGTLDPEGALLEPGPDLYDRMMRALADNLAACLRAP
jgi:zinc transport system substrate-binding protein